MENLDLHIAKINSKNYYIEGCIGDLTLFSAEGKPDELFLYFLENPLNLEENTLNFFFAMFHSYFKTKYSKKLKKGIKISERESASFLSELGDFVIKKEHVKES